MTFAGRWIALETTMLNEISHDQKRSARFFSIQRLYTKIYIGGVQSRKGTTPEEEEILNGCTEKRIILT